MYFFYILKKYVKNFLLILLSLSFFFIIIDLITNYKKLPDSSNLTVLYIYYDFLYAFDLFYALSLIFAFLLTGYYMIKFNEFVSFYSLGFSIKKLLKPFLFLSVLIYFIFVIFDSSKLAYIKVYANAILNHNQYSNENLFIKYNDNIVYIKKITPIINTATDIKVFILENKKIKKIIYAKKAVFKNHEWFAKNAQITFFDDNQIKTIKKDLTFLKNFKPKIVSNLKELNAVSLYDAFVAIKYFKDINTNTILSMAFFKIFTPLSILGLIIVFMVKMPLHLRIFNVGFFLIQSVFISILVWGLEFLLYKFAKQGVLSPYIIIIPSFVIFTYGLYLLKKES